MCIRRICDSCVQGILAIGLLVALLALIAPMVAMANDFPSKSFTLIVPFAAGGSADVQARLIAKGLSKRLGKPVVVDNRPGAGGTIGAALAARAPADGYTLLSSNFSMLVSEPLLQSNATIDLRRELTPVILTTEQSLVLVVPQNSSVKDLKDLISQARAQPEKFTYASWGEGSSAHLMGEMLQSATRTTLIHVPYKGSTPAITDMIGGHVSMMFGSPFGTMAHIRAGRLRALAVTGSKRMSALLNVPTLTEQGIAGLELRVWTCLMVPVKTPKDIISRLHSEISAVLDSPEFVRAAEDDGVEVVGGSPQELATRIESDVALIEKLVKTMNLKRNQ